MSEEATPSIEELIETAKFHKKRLESHCGFASKTPCFRCRTSQKIVKAWNKYEETRLNTWPDEIAACEKCESLSKVGRWGMSEDCCWNICEPCYNDKEGFQKWLEGQFKIALDENPDYELLPDGKYRYVGEEKIREQL
jgi:hypothetical protein